VRDNHRADFTMPLKQSHNSNFASGLISSSSRRSKLRNPPSQRRLVHVARFAADESLVNFNMAAQLTARLIILQPKSDSLQHEPSGLLRYLDRAVNFPRANAILTVSEHPHSAQPLVQADRRILKNGS